MLATVIVDLNTSQINSGKLTGHFVAENYIVLSD